jgi:hypothetical protein
MKVEQECYGGGMNRRLMLTALVVVSVGFCAAAGRSFRPGEVWLDNHGVAINAHGGGILSYRGLYYWFGEHKIAGPGGNSAQVGVHCYSSKNLYDWTDAGVALAVSQDPASEIAMGSVIERPKVIYNRRNHKFVMWFHLELKGKGYGAALAGVATADRPVGPYTFLRAVRPDAGRWPLNMPEAQRKLPVPQGVLRQGSPEWLEAAVDGGMVRRDFEGGQMARDLNLFVDDDGTAYLIASSEENATIHISQLSDDYLSSSGRWIRVFPGGHSEAPAVFKRNGRYYMFLSGCTGWSPNPGRAAVADSMLGKWHFLGNPVHGSAAQESTTFESQPTYVLRVKSGKHETYIYMGDRWRPRNPIDGRYVWLPIAWDGDEPVLRWSASWSLHQ